MKGEKTRVVSYIASLTASNILGVLDLGYRPWPGYKPAQPVQVVSGKIPEPGRVQTGTSCTGPGSGIRV